jgi:hypothetical protein
LKIKALLFFEKFETTHPKTQRQTPEELARHKRKHQNSQDLQTQKSGGFRPLVCNAIDKVNELTKVWGENFAMNWKLHFMSNIFRVMKSMRFKWPNMHVYSVHV